MQNSGPDASDDEEVAEEGVVEEGKGNEKEDEVCIPAFDGDFVTSSFEQQHLSICKERDETKEEKNNVSTESLEDYEKLEKAETVILEPNMSLSSPPLSFHNPMDDKIDSTDEIDDTSDSDGTGGTDDSDNTDASDDTNSSSK